MSVGVKNKLIGELQRRAVDIANGYLYGVHCTDDLFCEYAKALWAYELAENSECDGADEPIKCVNAYNLPACGEIVSTTTNCAISITDITEVVSCTSITITDIT